MTTPCRTEDGIRDAVRERYARVAEGSTPPAADDVASAVGYDERDLQAVPEGANLGLGCGNPVALASLRPGEVVLDLGSGAGFDVFLAAAAVGQEGRVIGVDMTPEMIAKAQENARKAGSRQHRVPPRHDRGSPGRGRRGRRGDLELRDQPLDRQAEGLP